MTAPLSPDELLALRAYAQGQRPYLTATRLGAARNALAAAGFVEDCGHQVSPMYIAVTGAGHDALAANAEPVQLELFALAGGAR